MLGLMAGAMYYGLKSLYPGFPGLGLQLKIAAVCLMVSFPYYFSALVAFFFSPLTLAEQSESKGLVLAGRLFAPDVNFWNPANHIIAATITLLLGLVLLFA